MSETRTYRRVIMTQLLHLWEFLNTHRDIAVGYNKSIQARQQNKEMWERAANILHSAGEGAIKSASEWSKEYQQSQSYEIMAEITASQHSTIRLFLIMFLFLQTHNLHQLDRAQGGAINYLLEQSHHHPCLDRTQQNRARRGAEGGDDSSRVLQMQDSNWSHLQEEGLKQSWPTAVL